MVIATNNDVFQNKNVFTKRLAIVDIPPAMFVYALFLRTSKVIATTHGYGACEHIDKYDVNL